MSPLRAIVQQDLSRGTNTVTNPYDIGQQQSLILQNILLSEHGSLTVRDGTVQVTRSPDAAGACRPIVKLFDFIKATTTDPIIYKLAILRGDGVTTQNQLFNRGNTPWSFIGTLNTTYQLPDILTFTNLALIINGYEVPYSWNGLILQHLIDAPGTGRVPAGAKHHALHQGFYWVWNTAATSLGPGGTASSFTTALAGAQNDLKFTAQSVGVAGDAITIEYTADGAFTPLSVSVVGLAVTVHVATDGANVPISLASQVLTAVNTYAPAAAILSASLAPANDGSGVVIVLAATNLAGGADAGLSVDGPSSLRSSALNDPNSWPLDFQIWIDKDDGDQGMGMGHFTIAESGISPLTSQILFKEFSAYQMTGVFLSTNPLFSIQKIKSDMGCIAPRTIKFAPGFGILRLSHRGVALFDGVDDKLISEEIRPFLFGSEAFGGIDRATAIGSQGVVVANPPCYVLFCPVQGEGLTRVFCYDLVRKAWTILAYPHAVSTAQAITNPSTQPLTLIGDFDAGSVRSIFNPAATQSGTDDGDAIVWNAILRPVSAPSPQQRGYFRRSIVKVSNTAVTHYQIQWVAVFGPMVGNPVRQKFGMITLPAMVPANIGIGGYGFDAYGLYPYGGVVTGGPEADCTIDLGFIADNMRLILSGTGRCIIRGIEHHVTSKPLGRPSVYV